MAELVRAERPDLLEAAVAALGADPFEHLDDGTAYLQPAIYCASMAQLARRTGPEPEF
jgi:[acyl-carrier-protein] S-malonyltransferase